MGLLAPLYALAALAIAAPVIFHLIRRQPRGQVEFSSLMFLQPSPPRLTRRSRLDNLWLLLIRAAALGLIALAFARPFLRSAELAEAQPVGRQILLLVDTSGSMQREEVWQSALRTATHYIDGLGDNDRIGLATFDTAMRIEVPLPAQDELAGRSGEAGRAAVRKKLQQLKPGYRGTKLAEQLIAAAELLQTRSTAGNATPAASESEIVLVSDLHEGGGLDALQGYAWPENVRLDIRRIAPAEPGNARATLMQGAAEDSSAGVVGDQKRNSNDIAQRNSAAKRVRVENNANSTQTVLSLRWLSPREPADAPVAAGPASTTVHIQVPPGQARVVPVPPAVVDADRIVLSGDHATFDNVLYVPRTQPRQERLGFVGRTSSQDEDDLFFFLSRVPLSTQVRNVSVERMKVEDLTAAATDELLAGLVVEWPIDRATVATLEDFARTGRPVIVVLSRSVSTADAQSATDAISSATLPEAEEALGALLGSEQAVKLTEASGDDFAMLSDIDFRHPLFQPLSDAKFNDFGKVRFWSHRVIGLPDQGERDETLRVVARFDDRAPAILLRPIGRGNLWVLAAGWQATASQLALSSKFVPLLYGMLDPEGRALDTTSVYEVGEPIEVAPGATVSLAHLDGSPVDAPSAAGPIGVDQPGIYWLNEDGKRRQIAVALPLSESQLDPLDLDRFAQYGVVTGKSDSAKERQAAARISQVSELESRQKLWRWMLVAAIGLLILETLLAARREKGSALGIA